MRKQDESYAPNAVQIWECAVGVTEVNLVEIIHEDEWRGVFIDADLFIDLKTQRGVRLRFHDEIQTRGVLGHPLDRPDATLPGLGSYLDPRTTPLDAPRFTIYRESFRLHSVARFTDEEKPSEYLFSGQLDIRLWLPDGWRVSSDEKLYSRPLDVC